MSLKVFHSNRLEILADELAETLRVPLKSPMQPEIIVVQSKGMERWISLQIASKHGICANINFPFPNTLVTNLFQSTGIETDWEAEFDPEKMCWKIMKLLPSFVDKPGFENIGNYLKNTDGNLKRYQLAEKLREHTRHMLLMTATPHNGIEEDFQLFLQLIDKDRFEGRFRSGVHSVDITDIYRRMVKEDLLTFEEKKLFPERIAYTKEFPLSPAEDKLYKEVTNYVKDQFNRAEQKGEKKKKRPL